MPSLDMSKLINRHRVSPRHLLAVAMNWALIAGCVAASLYAQNLLVTLLSLIVIGARQHALVVLMHEASHYHFAKNKTLNDALSNIFCAFPLTLETDVYRKVHLAHHRHLNTSQDPDHVRKDSQSGWNLPATPKQIALFIPAFIFAIGPKEMTALLWGFSGFATPKRWFKEPKLMAFKMSYYLAIAATALYFGFGTKVLLYWFVPVLFVLPFVARVRNLSEHSVLTWTNENNSSREIIPGKIERFLLAPHFVHHHLTHHHYPHIPFYNLPKAHQMLVESGFYSDAHMNTSYFVPYRGSVLADVVHGPRREPSSLGKAA